MKTGCAYLPIDFEEEFAIEIPDEDIWNLATVGDVAEYVDRHTGK